MSNPVSVVICIHNRADYLRRTLDTFVIQEHPDWELVLVDDRSQDDVGGVLAEYANRIPYITWMQIDKTIAPIPLGPGTSQGIGTSMNIGHRQASFGTILRCDPETLQLSRTLWEAGALDVGNTAWYVPIFDVGIDHFNQIVEMWDELREDPASIPEQLFPSEQPLKSWWYMEAVWGRDNYLSIGGVDENFTRGAACEDDDFVYRWRKKGYETRWPDMLALHQYHGGRIWHGTPEHGANFQYLQGWQSRPVVANQDINSDECIIDIVDMGFRQGTERTHRDWQTLLPGNRFASMPEEDYRAYYRLCSQPLDARVLEVGVYLGCSTIVSATASHNARLPGVCIVDPFNDDGLGGGEEPFEDQFRANIDAAGYTDIVQVIPGRIQDVELPDEQFRVILIDGDHRRCAEDFELLRPYLHPEGVLAIHDWHWGHPTIDELADRLQREAKSWGHAAHLVWFKL